MPRYSWKIEEILFEEDVRAIYDLADGPEVRALISLLWLTGARPQEILNLKPENFFISNDQLAITLETLKLGQGKEFKVRERTLKFSRPTGLSVNIYLETIISFLEKIPIGSRVLDYSERWAEIKINKLGEKAINKKICPYHFRHSVFSWMIKNGATVSDVMYFKGARSVASVSPYLHALPYLTKLESMDRRRVRTEPAPHADALIVNKEAEIVTGDEKKVGDSEG
jgi:integrase